MVFRGTKFTFGFGIKLPQTQTLRVRGVRAYLIGEISKVKSRNFLHRGSPF
jgi:hypothetical protein